MNRFVALLIAAVIVAVGIGALSNQTLMNGTDPGGPILQYFVLAPYFIVLVLVMVTLWILSELAAWGAKFLPEGGTPNLRKTIVHLQTNAGFSLVILFSMIVLGFTVGYSAGNSRESVIGPVITAAIAALGGVVAYWFAKDSDYKGLSALAVAVFSIALLYGGTIGADIRQSYEVHQINWELYKLAKTSQINVSEYGQKAVIDLKKSILESTLVSSTVGMTTLTASSISETLPITTLASSPEVIPTPSTGGGGKALAH